MAFSQLLIYYVFFNILFAKRAVSDFFNNGTPQWLPNVISCFLYNVYQSLYNIFSRKIHPLLSPRPPILGPRRFARLGFRSSPTEIYNTVGFQIPFFGKRKLCSTWDIGYGRICPYIPRRLKK